MLYLAIVYYAAKLSTYVPLTHIETEKNVHTSIHRRHRAFLVHSCIFSSPFITYHILFICKLIDIWSWSISVMLQYIQYKVVGHSLNQRTHFLKTYWYCHLLWDIDICVHCSRQFALNLVWRNRKWNFILLKLSAFVGCSYDIISRLYRNIFSVPGRKLFVCNFEYYFAFKSETKTQSKPILWFCVCVRLCSWISWATNWKNQNKEITKSTGRPNWSSSKIFH